MNLNLTHKSLIVISGLIWLAAGSFLLPLGLNFLLQAVENSHMNKDFSYPLLNMFSTFTSGVENSVILLIAIGLVIGYSKGKYILGKSAVKGVERIRSFPEPTNLINIYNAKYYILLALMVGLGMSMKFLGLPEDVRGVIDVAIGSALINGAMIYFRMAFQSKAIA